MLVRRAGVGTSEGGEVCQPRSEGRKWMLDMVGMLGSSHTQPTLGLCPACEIL